MNLDELQQNIRAATSPAFRDQLLARGQARSMIWRDGVLPQGAPRFSPNLSYDLQSYAYALLSLAIRLREEGGDEILTRAGFEQSANALEALIAKGDPIIRNVVFIACWPHLHSILAAFRQEHFHFLLHPPAILTSPALSARWLYLYVARPMSWKGRSWNGTKMMLSQMISS